MRLDKNSSTGAYAWKRIGSVVVKVEVTKETAQCVFFMTGGRETRENKKSIYHEYFNSPEEAYDSAIALQTEYLNKLLKMAKQAEDTLGLLKIQRTALAPKEAV